MSKSPSQNDKLLKTVYFQIIEGYSPATIDGDTVWVKHFDLKDQGLIDDFYDEARKRAQKKGLPTEEELVKRLIEDGHWSEEEEAKLAQIQKALKGLIANKGKALNKAMSTAIEDNIAERTAALKEIEGKKRSLMHDTCEDYANKRSNDLIVKISFFKDKEGERYFSDEDFEYLERGEINNLVGVYNVATEPLTVDNIKEIAAQDFFTPYYSIVEKNPIDFFGKKVYDLTFFQLNLLNYGRLINSIHKNFHPPDHIRTDAAALISFAENEQKKHKRQASKKPAPGGPSVIGRK